MIILIKIRVTKLTRSFDKETQKRRSHRNKQMLLMLVVNNFYFIACSLPLCIVMIYKRFDQPSDEPAVESHSQEDSTSDDAIESIQSFFNIMIYTNNSFNFLFFILFLKKYRKISLDLGKKIKTWFQARIQRNNNIENVELICLN
jgi:hypothetical protein